MSEEGLKVSVLSSGSTGNVTYIETPEHKVLVDAGLSGKKIAGLMESVGRDIHEVDSLFVTHEHSKCWSVSSKVRDQRLRKPGYLGCH